MRHDELLAHGRGQRLTMPRSQHAVSGPRDRDPLAILHTQNTTRLEHLVDLRLERMAASPFAFYRGTAGIMAADLADEPTTGIRVVSCGDAHISNFGFYASPQRNLVFDLNDFDEACIAPWEWDLKRFVTSVVIGARDSGFTESNARVAALAAGAAYREQLAAFMQRDVLDRYYFRMDAERIREGLESGSRRVLDRAIKQARRRTSLQAVEKMSELNDDERRVFIEKPPILTAVAESARLQLSELFEKYRSTVSSDIALVLSQYELTDIALRVVGVGSVGTRCYVLLLTGPAGESLVLQIKQAEASVLRTWGRSGAPDDDRHHGERVVMNQRILQAVSDPFLGYLEANGWDFYVRQFRDKKGSIELEGLGFDEFMTYVQGCGIALARAHSQSPDAASIVGYLGGGAAVDRAIAEWSFAYADQSLADFTALREYLGSR